MSLKRRKIGPRLLLITNRKLHTRFRFVPKSTTLDDLEQPLRTLFQNTCVFGAHNENLNEDRPTLSQRQRRSQMTLSSGNIRFMLATALGFLVYQSFHFQSSCPFSASPLFSWVDLPKIREHIRCICVLYMYVYM